MTTLHDDQARLAPAGSDVHGRVRFDRAAPLHRREWLRLFEGWAILTGIFTAVGYGIRWWWEPSWFGARDVQFSRWLAAHRTPHRNHLAELGSGLSNTETKIAMLLALLPVMLWAFRRWHDWMFLVVGLVFEVSVFGVSSKLVLRGRPPVEQLDGAPTNSWPSGHVSASIVFYVGLALVMSWNTTSRAVRVVFTVLAVAAPVIVMTSRLYQGMHYASDIAGGVVLAAITLVFVRRMMIEAGQDPRRTAA